MSSSISTSPNIHWLGAGLSSVPGIRRLAQSSLPLIVWNRSPEKAEQALTGIEGNNCVKVFDAEALTENVQSGDIVVSMLPGSWHIRIAEICLQRKAHFISSSYISPEMQALDSNVRAQGLCFVNEVGLDPGLDHLMAHALVEQYKQSNDYRSEDVISFRSYCGGFPAVANVFRYKFSWSPLGVLRALKTPSRSIRDGKVIDVARPWQAISDYTARLPAGQTECFEAYPNRDALPFMATYHFDLDWPVQEFVRGTLRLNGWSSAWQDIFNEIESLDDDKGEARLQEMSDELWQDYAYGEDEADRVVLCVELEVRREKKPVWHRNYSIDALANENGSAMARLVSLTVSLAVDSLLKGEIQSGVSAAPAAAEIVEDWFTKLRELGEIIELNVIE
ncbi:MAG: saccharopine dehydrogenase [Gammaproteobacteria bacterium]|nr:saccharopine dehydrogenase [Gammaproteobacteria bacterium]